MTALTITVNVKIERKNKDACTQQAPRSQQPITPTFLKNEIETLKNNF
jgi:hypothetical protein